MIDCKRFHETRAIDILVRDYDVPQEIANRLVARTEAETEQLVNQMIGYIEYVVERHKEAMEETT